MTKIMTHVLRGSVVESTHEAKCIILDNNFKTIFSTNHSNDLTYPRSAIKIFQALPFIISKAHKKFNLSQKQIAICCASHFGETEHLKVLEQWLKKINVKKRMLKCGIHNPLNSKYSNKLFLGGNKPNQLHNNCSGKHLGMLSGCLTYNMDINKYVDIEHPYQIKIRNILEFFTKQKINSKQKGIDGCSAPQYAFALKNLSIAMINLIKQLEKNNLYSKEVKLLLDSIKKYPHLIGSKNNYDTQLMLKTKGKMFAKGGAEGVLLFAHKKKKIGGIIKIKDGNERAIPSVANEIFKKLKILEKNELDNLSTWSNQKIFNHAKKNIGKIYSKIKL